jgi:hypothetical protein
MALTKVSYSMITGAPVNALDFGFSTTNTSVQNQTALQNAINSFGTGLNNSGGRLYIPKGIYSVKAPITIMNNGLIIEGDGSYSYQDSFTRGTVLLFNDVTNDPNTDSGLIFSIDSSVANTRSAILRDINIQGGVPSSPTNINYLQNGILVSGSVLIDNVNVQLCKGPGILLASNVLDTRVQNSTSTNNGAGLRIGGTAAPGSNTTVSISNCAFRVNTVGFQIVDCDGVHVSDSVIESNSGEGLWINNATGGNFATNILFTRTHFENNGIFAGNADYLPQISFQPVSTSWPAKWIEFNQCSISGGWKVITATAVQYLTFRNCAISMTQNAGLTVCKITLTSDCKYINWIDSLIDGLTGAGPTQYFTFPTGQGLYSYIFNSGVIYREGTWTPGLSNMTVVGSPTVEGTYIRQNRLITCRGTITCSVGNTVASTAGTSYISGLPFASAADSTGSIAGIALAFNGVSAVRTSSLYTPTFSAQTNSIAFQFSYETNANNNSP